MLVKRIETSEEKMDVDNDPNDEIAKYKEEVDDKKKEIKKVQKDLEKEKENGKKLIKEIDEKNKKVCELENTNTRLRLMLDQSKEIADKRSNKEVRFDSNRTRKDNANDEKFRSKKEIIIVGW